MSFKEYLHSFRFTWRAVTGLAVILAGSLKFTSIVPPWPDESGAGATSLAFLACIIGITLGFFAESRSSRLRRRWGCGCLGLAMVLLVVYLYLLSSRVANFYELVDGRELVRRVIIGTQTVHLEDAAKQPGDILNFYGPHAYGWTHQSVVDARSCLVTAYVTFFFVLTLGLGLLQSSESRSAARRTDLKSLAAPAKDT